jgi:hypothetical protein
MLLYKALGQVNGRLEKLSVMAKRYTRQKGAGTSEMVRQAQKVYQLRDSKGVLGESPLRQQKEEDGGGWFSRIATFFKAWGDQKWTTKSGKKSSETGERYLPKRGNTGAKPSRVRSNNKSQASGKSTGKTVRARSHQAGKSKSKTVQKG